jgi:hypothetical protein
MIFFQICGLAIIHKRNEPNFGYRSDMESIFFQDSCLVLATNRNSLSKYGACDPFFSQNKATFFLSLSQKEGSWFHICTGLWFFGPSPPKKNTGRLF